MADLHRILVVGVGSIGERHTRCFLTTNRAEISICEISDSLRHDIANRYQVSAAYPDLDAALTEAYDAVVIASPAHTHIPIAIQCARHNIHLLIEKPLSTSLQDIGQLKEIIAQQKLIAAVAYSWRSFREIQALKELLESGRFGKPLNVYCVSGQPFPHFRPAYRDVYYADRKTGGGAIQDALTHMINGVEWLVGPTDRLVADAEHLKLEGVAVEDTVNLIARHGPVMVSYSLNQHQAPNDSSLTVVCESGTVRFEAHHSRVGWVTEPAAPWEYQQFEQEERDAIYIRQAHRFLDTLEGKCTPICSLEEGEQTLRVNLAALQSAESGSWQTVNESTSG